MLRKAEALRAAFGVPADVPLVVAVEGMSKSMGFPSFNQAGPAPVRLKKRCYSCHTGRLRNGVNLF